MDYLITGLIYSRSEQYTPGQMTDIRSYLVKNETLAKAAVSVNFQKYLMHANSKLQTTIDKFLDWLDVESPYYENPNNVKTNVDLVNTTIV